MVKYIVFPNYNVHMNIICNFKCNVKFKHWATAFDGPVYIQHTETTAWIIILIYKIC
jgi:hypothetical protein